MVIIERTYICGVRLHKMLARGFNMKTSSRASVYLLRMLPKKAGDAVVFKAVLYNKHFEHLASTAWDVTASGRVDILFEACGYGIQRITGDAPPDWRRLV